MEREKTLEQASSCSIFHRISHLVNNHGFQVVSFTQKCPTCLSLSSSPPDTELVSLAFIFPWEELSLEQSSQGGPAAYSSGAALHNFSGNLIPHSPPQFCTGRAQSTGANIPIFHHFNDFFFFLNTGKRKTLL